MDKYLQPTSFLDFDHPDVKAFVRETIRDVSTPREKAVRLFYAVRNDICYNPYRLNFTVKGMRASTTLRKGFSWCVGKAVLLSAACRAAGIPAQLGFADVHNHQNPENISKALKTNIYYWHGYSLLYLNGKWVKATPAFDLNLCKRLDIIPVEFDGEKDAVFHLYDRQGRLHMEYLNDRGAFDDLPLEQIIETFRDEYSKEALNIFLSMDTSEKRRAMQVEKQKNQSHYSKNVK